MNPHRTLSDNFFQFKMIGKPLTHPHRREKSTKTLRLRLRYLQIKGEIFNKLRLVLVIFSYQNNSICLSLNEGASNRPSTKGLSSNNERGDGSTKSVTNLSLVGSRKSAG